ncbi:MAG: hypothetical protein M3238_02715 [Actinomycetota bacterium]|nr:hypothetical protein [Actinomycetota bacterium]
MIVLLLVGLGGAILVAGAGRISDLVDLLERSAEPIEIEGPRGVLIEPVSPSGYRGVRPLVADLRRGGLACGSVTVDHADATISTGSCQAAGTHVQINVYFTRASLVAVRRQMRGSPFTFVHDDNWFVITQEATARRVQRILGGRLVIAN